jgi:hypothetical protein
MLSGVNAHARASLPGFVVDAAAICVLENFIIYGGGDNAPRA